MKKNKSISIAFFFLFFSSVQAMATAHMSRLFPLSRIKKIENGSTLQTVKLIEVESQPWGLGLAILFIIFGVIVMKIGTPSPTFFLTRQH